MAAALVLQAIPAVAPCIAVVAVVKYSSRSRFGTPKQR